MKGICYRWPQTRGKGELVTEATPITKGNSGVSRSAQIVKLDKMGEVIRVL